MLYSKQSIICIICYDNACGVKYIANKILSILAQDATEHTNIYTYACQYFKKLSFEISQHVHDGTQRAKCGVSNGVPVGAVIDQILVALLQFLQRQRLFNTQMTFW